MWDFYCGAIQIYLPPSRAEVVRANVLRAIPFYATSRMIRACLSPRTSPCCAGNMHLHLVSHASQHAAKPRDISLADTSGVAYAPSGVCVVPRVQSEGQSVILPAARSAAVFVVLCECLDGGLALRRRGRGTQNIEEPARLVLAVLERTVEDRLENFQAPQPRLNLRQRLHRIKQHLLIQQQTQRCISGFLNEMNTGISFNGDLPSKMAIEIEFWSLAGFRCQRHPRRLEWSNEWSPLGQSDESDDDSNPGNWAGESALSSDSDDDVLEVCLLRLRSNSSRDSHSSRSPDGVWSSFAGALSKTSTSKMIVPIAPARLKTMGMGNGWEGGEWVGTRDEGLPEEVQHLLPPSRRMLTPGRRTNVLTHHSAYFSADGVYNYLGGPDLGVEFGPTLEPRGQRGSARTGAEILEIETEGAAPSPLGSRSKSRSKSRSRSRTPSPAILSSSPNGASGVGVSMSPGAASPRSPAGSLLSPPLRRRDSSQSSTSSASQGRSRGAMCTSGSSSLSDRERSRSSHTSPLGSLSPEYGGVHVGVDYGSGGCAYVGPVKDIRYGGHGSVNPKGGASVSPEKGAPASVGRDATALEEGSLTSNSGSSGVTATRPRVEVNGVRTGAGRVDGEEAEAEYETQGRGCSSTTRRRRRTRLCSGSTASATPPGSHKKPTSPTSKSTTISPPRARPVNGALLIEEEPQYEYGSAPEETDEVTDRSTVGVLTCGSSSVTYGALGVVGCGSCCYANCRYYGAVDATVVARRCVRQRAS
ncbi:hypothetical protein DFH08DRAFT_796899 [Mycena albidolilacea]|uniref:Uncharacterized protein n=1 Tax=Mycena albidolilacea TaxID=1033008 RepID=A0AAD7AWD8_9AGAR|nr:hypothetical protein DFH08DRAFT_796899 [Mycena albidolilacea]